MSVLINKILLAGIILTLFIVDVHAYKIQSYEISFILTKIIIVLYIICIYLYTKGCFDVLIITIEKGKRGMRNVIAMSENNSSTIKVSSKHMKIRGINENRVVMTASVCDNKLNVIVAVGNYTGDLEISAGYSLPCALRNNRLVKELSHSVRAKINNGTTIEELKSELAKESLKFDYEILQ